MNLEVQLSTAGKPLAPEGNFSHLEILGAPLNSETKLLEHKKCPLV